MIPVNNQEPLIPTEKIVPDNRTELLLKDIRDHIMTAGNNGAISIKRYDDLESIDISHYSQSHLNQVFSRLYFLETRNWSDKNQLTVFEVTALAKTEEGPIEYFTRIANGILESPHLFSEKALHTFYILYLNFFDVISRNLNLRAPTAFDAFGYHSVEQFKAMGIANSFNSGKALCYIPIIGTFGGILRIASTRYGTRRGSTPSANKGILVRGVFETCSLGILLILPDLIVTVVRSLKK